MKHLKKLLIGLTILFSFLFINNVSALQGENITPIQKVLVNDNINRFLSKIHETGRFLYYSNSYDEKYYFAIGNNYSSSSNRTAFTVATDYPELISFGSYYADGKTLSEVLINVEYNPNKPVYLYYIDASSSSYKVNKISENGTITNFNNNTESAGIKIEENSSYFITGFVSPSYTSWDSICTNVTSSGYNDSMYYFTTNYEGAIYYKNINLNINSANTLYFKENNLFINDNMPLIYNYSLVTTDTSLEPQLEYKTGFISSDAYSVLGKVTNNFSIDSDLLEYRNYKFKLQFGSNDFTNENIPVFSHYKIFGLNRGTNNYESLDKYLNENFEKKDKNALY